MRERAKLKNDCIGAFRDPEQIAGPQRAQVHAHMRGARWAGRREEPAPLSLERLRERVYVARQAQSHRPLISSDFRRSALGYDLGTLNDHRFVGGKRNGRLERYACAKDDGSAIAQRSCDDACK
jgi:hypothetical protein